MQSVLIIQGFVYMLSVSILERFICEVSLLLSALYAKCPRYSGLYSTMQSVLIIQGFICTVSMQGFVYVQSVSIIE